MTTNSGDGKPPAHDAPGKGDPGIKSIWQRSNPFGKFESKKIHKTKEDEERERAEAEKASRSAASASAVEGADVKPEDVGMTEEEIAALKSRGKLPTIIKVVDFTGAAEGSMLKMTVSVRNYGDALARDVKVKCIGNARLRILASPMATIGDITPRAKSVAQFSYDMPDNFCEEYANFAVTAEAENAKPFSQLFTLKTGRKPMSASEIMEQLEKGKGKDGKGGKDGGKH